MRYFCSFEIHKRHFSLKFLLLLLTLFKNGDSYMVGNNPHHRLETLDSQGKYQLEWKVDWNSKKISFNVTVETRGYIGFGLSSNGKMRGADIVIGGVLQNGQSYFSDRHAIANQLPVEDESQDWTFHEARETRTHTFLSFSRAFDTCDPHDYPITEDKISIIWTYGERDNEVAYHHRNRGEYQVYLLHPDYTPPIVQDNNVGSRDSQNEVKGLKIWTVNTRMEIPSEDTTYWCTMHKGPALSKKHHLIGLEVRFPNEQSRSHVHHLLMHRCRAPEGRDPQRMFAHYLGHRGQLCFSVKAPVGPMPTEYCTELYTPWAVGGRPYFHPPHIGTPIGEDEEEYYLLQVHYDNPQRLSGVEVDLSIDYFLTDELRENDAGFMVTRHDSPGLTPSLLIPPSTVEHQVYGICGGGCTQEILPPEGIRIFSIILHSHNTGVAIRFQHFRDGMELPWVQNDDNYAFNYQQIRPLNREVRVLPGDMLVVRCTYDSTSVNGTVVGGFSSQQEMCAAFFFYHNKIDNYIQCSSEIESEVGRERFLGIGNVTWSNRDLEFIVDEPEDMAGLRVTQVSDNYVDWNVDRREEFQRFILREPHVNRCPQELYSLPASEGYRRTSSGRAENDDDPRKREVEYPYIARAYRPKQSCSFV